MEVGPGSRVNRVCGVFSGVNVPVEMTGFVVLKVSRGIDRTKVEAWARSLLSHAD